MWRRCVIKRGFHFTLMDKNLCRLLKVHFCYKWTSQLYDRSPKLKTVWSAEEKQTKTSLLKRTKKWTKNCFLLGGLFKSKRITGYHSIFFLFQQPSATKLYIYTCWHMASAQYNHLFITGKSKEQECLLIEGAVIRHCLHLPSFTFWASWWFKPEIIWS